jgi:PAS domain-containing protein
MEFDRRTATILDAIREGVVVCDANGVVNYANNQAQLLLRRRQHEVLGQNVFRVIPDLKDSPAEAQLERALNAGGTAVFDHFSSSLYLWYEIRCIPLDGSMVLLLKDNTDRNRTMQSEAVREALRQVLKQAPIAISIVRGPDHRFELVNDYARRLIGDRELEGRTARSVFPELEGQGLFHILDEVYRTGQPWSANEVAITFDKTGSGTMTEGIFNITYQPFFEVDGKVAGVISLSVEVTDLVERDRALREREK